MEKPNNNNLLHGSYDPFGGFRLQKVEPSQHIDLNQLMTQAVSHGLKSIQLMTQAAFQELTENHLMTQVDS